MSTHAIVNFYPLGHGPRSSDPVSSVYVHHDGYPRGLGQDLANFLMTPEYKVHQAEPEFLAGAFIVWKTRRIIEARSEFRDGRGYEPSKAIPHIAIGPVCDPKDHGAEYFYHVMGSGVTVDGVWDPYTEQYCPPGILLTEAIEIDRRPVNGISCSECGAERV
jgi:hypothetical protein